MTYYRYAIPVLRNIDLLIFIIITPTPFLLLVVPVYISFFPFLGIIFYSLVYLLDVLKLIFIFQRNNIFSPDSDWIVDQKLSQIAIVPALFRKSLIILLIQGTRQSSPSGAPRPSWICSRCAALGWARAGSRTCWCFV